TRTPVAQCSGAAVPDSPRSLAAEWPLCAFDRLRALGLRLWQLPGPDALPAGAARQHRAQLAAQGNDLPRLALVRRDTVPVVDGQGRPLHARGRNCRATRDSE